MNRGGEVILIFGCLVVLGAGGAFFELGESYAIGSLLKLRFSTAELGEIACQVIVRHSLEGKGVETEFLDNGSARPGADQGIRRKNTARPPGGHQYILWSNPVEKLFYFTLNKKI